MSIWDKVCKTDPRHTKKVSQRGGFTAIDAHYQVQMATQEFGAVGTGWGYDCEYEFHDGAVICLLVFWYSTDGKQSRFGPIAGCSDFNTKRLDTDAPKKAMTDALTKALSHLGFNADVFLGKFDDNKYVAERSSEVVSEEAISSLRPEEIATYNEILDSGSGFQLVGFLNKYIDHQTGQYNLDIIEAFFSAGEKGAKTKRKKLHGQKLSDFWMSIQGYGESLRAAISNSDDQGITEYWDDVPELKKYIIGSLTNDDQNYLKARGVNANNET
tara:strand:- start:6 stop:818 length:813 start_codon:yes stop_codon:yes gene_type:complete